MGVPGAGEGKCKVYTRALDPGAGGARPNPTDMQDTEAKQKTALGCS